MHVTPLFVNLHWLPIAARIKFKTLLLAYKTTTGSAPLHLNALLQTYVSSSSLRSVSECHFIVPSQRGTKSLSQTFKINVPSWWIETCPTQSDHLQESAKKHISFIFIGTFNSRTLYSNYILNKNKNKLLNLTLFIY